MYNDLAEALEALKNKGFDHTFELAESGISCKKIDTTFSPEQLTIKETHEFDQGTDPGSEATIYAIQSNSGHKGTLVISYGKYVDPSKATLIDQLLNAQDT